ncbi:30S ribosomal protein S15 [Absidia repens]|uniref:30S ribosomal protein S15 n=1 Tax=Absidia repens TaxID=90262 RepID=A0A1X2IVJ8_9FUNG|nr:30S ribosomal protein S15 [Absidia repens]
MIVDDVLAQEQHKVIDWYKQKDGNTGSPEVQAAILPVHIHNLNSHLQQHKKDKYSYRQLRLEIHQCAKLLKYLEVKRMPFDIIIV